MSNEERRKEERRAAMYILKGVPARSIPNHPMKRLIVAATDNTGKEWPVGTEYVPHALGYNLMADVAYEDAAMYDGQTTFITITRFEKRPVRR